MSYQSLFYILIPFLLIIILVKIQYRIKIKENFEATSPTGKDENYNKTIKYDQEQQKKLAKKIKQLDEERAKQFIVEYDNASKINLQLEELHKEIDLLQSQLKDCKDKKKVVCPKENIISLCNNSKNQTKAFLRFSDSSDSSDSQTIETFESVINTIQLQQPNKPSLRKDQVSSETKQKVLPVPRSRSKSVIPPTQPKIKQSTIEKDQPRISSNRTAELDKKMLQYNDLLSKLIASDPKISADELNRKGRELIINSGNIFSEDKKKEYKEKIEKQKIEKQKIEQKKAEKEEQKIEKKKAEKEEKKKAEKEEKKKLDKEEQKIEKKKLDKDTEEQKKKAEKAEKEEKMIEKKIKEMKKEKKKEDVDVEEEEEKVIEKKIKEMKEKLKKMKEMKNKSDNNILNINIPEIELQINNKPKEPKIVVGCNTDKECNLFYGDGKNTCKSNNQCRCEVGSGILCELGPTNYKDPKDMTAKEISIFKNLSNYDNFTIQDYKNWLGLYKRDYYLLSDEHLINLRKSLRGEPIMLRDIPTGGLRPPQTSQKYFAEMYDKLGDLEQIVSPINSSTTGAQVGYNYNEYSDFSPPNAIPQLRVVNGEIERKYRRPSAKNKIFPVPLEDAIGPYQSNPAM